MMIIKLHQITEDASTFQFQILRSDLEKIEDHLTFDQMECKATLSKKTDTFILNGTYQVIVKTQCDSCLCPISLDLSEEFELLLQDEDEYEEPEGDLELSIHSNDVEFFSGQEINLVKHFEDQLLLDLPYSMICSDECKGLCSTCGVNLNESECQCQKDSGSHPFSVLKDNLS